MGALGSKQSKRFEEYSWSSFIECIGEMNRNYRSILVENDEYLCFALRREAMKNLDDDWRSNIEIICCKVNVQTKAVVSCKTLSAREFFSAYEVHKMLINNKRAKEVVDPMTTSQYILDQTSDIEGNCVICMENVNDLLLPCLHSFCLRCIVVETEYRKHNFSCPICKMPIEHPVESSWEVTDAPEPSEVTSYLKAVGNK